MVTYILEYFRDIVDSSSGMREEENIMLEANRLFCEGKVVSWGIVFSLVRNISVNPDLQFMCEIQGCIFL